MAKRNKTLHPDAPLLHQDHPRPVTRRDFLRQGFISGTGVVAGGSIFNLLAGSRAAQAAISTDLQTLAGNLTNGCTLTGGAGGMPFICFDLAGGANLAGSNVLVGQNTQLDTLSTAGYSKLGLPGDRIPGGVETTPNASGTSLGDFTDRTLGLIFHSESAMLQGILEKVDIVGTAPNINGVVIPARSENDTGNNPHNPMYRIANTGRDGSVVTLIGSRNSDSGGNSMAPAAFLDPELRPTKVDRPSDVAGMVDTGNLTAILNDPKDVTAVMESIARHSDSKMGLVNTQLTTDAVVRDLVRCGYIRAAHIAEQFAGKDIDPSRDTDIVGPSGIFTQAEFDGDREFRKTASVMKMVIDGLPDSYAGSGTISMGGYDYHTGDRRVGEARDLRAGRCIGACLEYAKLRGRPLMIYVFSDGSVASNGMVDNSQPTGPDDPGGQGKLVWTGDNSSTAASFILVYNPNGTVPVVRDQIGWFRADGSVETSSSPAANNVNLLVETVMLNYLALQGREGEYTGPLGSNIANLIAFGQI